jgi:hypothetical protein
MLQLITTIPVLCSLSTFVADVLPQRGKVIWLILFSKCDFPYTTVSCIFNPGYGSALVTHLLGMPLLLGR